MPKQKLKVTELGLDSEGMVTMSIDSLENILENTSKESINGIMDEIIESVIKRDRPPEPDISNIWRRTTAYRAIASLRMVLEVETAKDSAKRTDPVFKTPTITIQ